MPTVIQGSEDKDSEKFPEESHDAEWVGEKTVGEIDNCWGNMMGSKLSIVFQESYVSATVNNPMKGYPYNITVMRTTPFLQQTRRSSGKFI